MTIQAQRKRRFTKLLLGLIFAVMAVAALAAVYQGRDWNVPQDAKMMRNPLPPSPEGRLAAAALYRDQCANCHGDRGRGDGAEGRMHWPAPRDFTDQARMSAMSDGELFYKISRGRRPMPPFAGKLSEEQRWRLVSYLRGFAADAPAAAAPPK